MTDRELTELAAKAAGLSGRWNEPFQWLDLDGAHTKGKARTAWSPLIDDGDALRLAVKLDISIRQQFAMVQAEYPLLDEEYNTRKVLCEGVLDDYYAATRRAIVRAAAEIGKKVDAPLVRAD